MVRNTDGGGKWFTRMLIVDSVKKNIIDIKKSYLCKHKL